MRDETEEEIEEHFRNNSRVFWINATNGHADNWKSAMGLAIFWTIASVAFFFAVFYLIELISIDTPLGRS